MFLTDHSAASSGDQNSEFDWTAGYYFQNHDAASSIIRIMNVVMWILHGGYKN
jgi:hypothetical protein